MPSTTAVLQVASWLQENGPKKLEQLLRAVIYHPSEPILIADNDRHHCDASSGAGKMLRLSRQKIIGRRLDEFVERSFQPRIPELWQDFLKRGEQAGVVRLVDSEGNVLDVEYTAKVNVLPARHLLVLRNKTIQTGTEPKDEVAASNIPAWVRDYAFYLLDVDGTVATWYSGAERLYGYTSAEVIGEQVDLLYPAGDSMRTRLREDLRRCSAEGHFGAEGWSVTKDGVRFWANVLTMALKDEGGALQGYARVVRDFSERHERDQNLLLTRERLRLLPEETTVAGIVSGEFDHIPEVNDAFLELVGYTREDLLAGRLNWPDLTPPEYSAIDELAHEEGLRFGACTPFEKKLIRKDGTQIPVLVATAVLGLSPFRWLTFIQDLRERERQERTEHHVVEEAPGFEEIIGRSVALKRVLGLVEVVAPTSATVLIMGETGTGKELVARAVHGMSPRRDRPFITLNCAAIPTGLLESELFGYERGAFTGALTQKIGRFEMAHRGTLFLDEVGDIPLELQPKLLRALQEKSFERLGGTKTIPIDVRLVAATNRNLTEMMEHKLFRSDLYYRLKVFPIITPPLRDHPEDIPALARHFTQKYAREMNKQIEKISENTIRALVSWTWPGNVRELENFIERSVILSRGPNLRAPVAELEPDATKPAGTRTLKQIEREHIVQVLRETGGMVSKAATLLGIPRTTLYALMKKLGISPKNL